MTKTLKTNINKEIQTSLLRLGENGALQFMKLSTEDEGLSASMITMMSIDAHRANLPICLKIGGCETKRDIMLARIIQAECIIAPMIQSEYDVKKFVKAAKSIYALDTIPMLAINIETIKGIKNLHNILKCPEAKNISRIVIGRTDLSGSIGISKDCVDNNEMFNCLNNVSKTVANTTKELFIGGNVSVRSITFFKKLPFITGFETRNFGFDASVLKSKDIASSIIKNALDTEKLLLQKKISFFSDIIESDKMRCTQIDKRLKI